MSKREEQALLRLLHNINYNMDGDVREESLESLITLVGVVVITNLQLKRGYWLSTSSRRYLLDTTIGNGTL